MMLGYHNRRMPKAIRRIYRLSSRLLCFFILLAALDRIPDPPVIQPHQDKAATFCCYNQHQVVADEDRVLDRVLFDPKWQVLSFEESLRSESKPPIQLVIYLSEISDSSPPSATFNT